MSSGACGPCCQQSVSTAGRGRSAQSGPRRRAACPDQAGGLAERAADRQVVGSRRGAVGQAAPHGVDAGVRRQAGVQRQVKLRAQAARLGRVAHPARAGGDRVWHGAMRVKLPRSTHIWWYSCMYLTSYCCQLGVQHNVQQLPCCGQQERGCAPNRRAAHSAKQRQQCRVQSACRQRPWWSRRSHRLQAARAAWPGRTGHCGAAAPSRKEPGKLQPCPYWLGLQAGAVGGHIYA